MTRRRLKVGTLMMSALMLFLFGRTWWQPRPALAPVRQDYVEAMLRAKYGDTAESEAHWRHRTCQPRHWRYIMMNR